MIHNIYRYRSINHLLNDNELKNHYFFLPTITGENDINEDNPVLYFKGSKYYWLGLFRYYYLYVYNEFFIGSNKSLRKNLENINDNEFLNNYIVNTLCSKVLNNIHIYQYQFSLIFSILDNVISYYILKRLRNSNIYSNNSIVNDIIKYCDNMNSMWERNLTDPENVKAQREIFKVHTENKLNWLHKRNVVSLKSLYNIGIEKDYEFYNRLHKIQASMNYAKNTKPLTSVHKSFYEKLSSFILPETCIVSFSTTPTNDAMWANYADKYTGVCLQFAVNNGKLMTNGHSNNIHKVSYRCKLPNYNLFSHLNYNNKDVRYAFREAFKHGASKNYNEKNARKVQIKSASIKDISWKTENERRLIYINPCNHKQVYNIHDLRSITLGSNISGINAYRVIKVADDLSKKNKLSIIPIYKIYRINGHIKRTVIWNKHIYKVDKEFRSMLRNNSRLSEYFKI